MVFPIQTTFPSSTSSSSLPTTPSAQWLPSFAGHVAPPPSRATADAAISAAAAAANAALGADRIIKHPARPEALRSSKRTLNTLALVDGSPQVSPSQLQRCDQRVREREAVAAGSFAAHLAVHRVLQLLGQRSHGRRAAPAGEREAIECGRALVGAALALVASHARRDVGRPPRGGGAASRVAAAGGRLAESTQFRASR